MSTFRPNRSVTYVDAAYCYRLRSMVCRSVCLSVGLSQSWALQNGWTDRDAVWVVESDGPKESCIRRGPDPHEKGQFWGGGAAPG